MKLSSDVVIMGVGNRCAISRAPVVLVIP